MKCERTVEERPFRAALSGLKKLLGLQPWGLTRAVAVPPRTAQCFPPRPHSTIPPAVCEELPPVHPPAPSEFEVNPTPRFR